MKRHLDLCAALFLLATVVVACAAPAALPPVSSNVPSAGTQTDLATVKTYLLGKTAALKTATQAVKTASDRYYVLAQAAKFDYAALWAAEPQAVSAALNDAKAAWLAASPVYERMEGIVAGTPSLSQLDLNLDAGPSAQQDAENAVTFDLTLPDGRVLPKPGNLFGVTESTLWGTYPQYTTGIPADLNGNGQSDFGKVLPDANILKAGADTLDQYAGDLNNAATAWEPTEAEAFGALVANVPTFSDFIESWKNSRFVAGSTATERDFVVISRLSDLSDNISSWQTLYAGLSPKVRTLEPDQDVQITKDLADLQAFVSDMYAQEKGGKHFTPEEADQLSAEGQERANAIAGEITQVAARLGVTLDNQ